MTRSRSLAADLILVLSLELVLSPVSWTEKEEFGSEVYKVVLDFLLSASV